MATVCTVWRESRGPIVRLISAPMKGSNGIHARSGSPANLPGSCGSILVPQRGESIDIDVAPAAEHRDDDRETDRCLGRCDCDDDERECVTREVAPHAREGDERHVR